MSEPDLQTGSRTLLVAHWPFVYLYLAGHVDKEPGLEDPRHGLQLDVDSVPVPPPSLLGTPEPVQDKVRVVRHHWT